MIRDGSAIDLKILQVESTSLSHAIISSRSRIIFTLNNTYLLHVHKTNLNIIQKQKIQMLFFSIKVFFSS